MKAMTYGTFGVVLGTWVLAGCSSLNTPTAQHNRVQNNERLGTIWGDEIRSSTRQVRAKRLSKQPLTVSTINYADKTFTGKPLNSVSLASGTISFSVIDDGGRPLPLVRQDNSHYLSGKQGQSYALRYQNHSNNTYEIIASVDGLDVLTGSSASYQHSGYILKPNNTLLIEGFRKSDQAVASFTFGKPQDSYANHNTQGSINNTGIIGTAVYQIRLDNDKVNTKYAPPPTTQPNAFPADP